MYKQLLTNPVHRPAIIAGVLMALLSALLNPMGMTYVSNMSLRLSGNGLRWAVFMSSISMAGAFALGELGGRYGMPNLSGILACF
jgi:hypothetical protein